SEIVVLHVNVIRIVKGVNPHAIVERNARSGWVWSAESIRMIGRMAACNFRCSETDHSQVGNVQVSWIRTVHRDVAIASARRRSAHLAKIAYQDAAIRLSFIFKWERAVRVRTAIGSLIPAPQVKAARNSTDGLDIDRSLRIDNHARLHSLT